MLSSWVACANLYFPFRGDQAGFDLLAAFLKQRVAPEVRTVSSIELEFALDNALSPQDLLGEPAEGSRGASQTSPDVAFIIEKDIEQDWAALFKGKARFRMLTHQEWVEWVRQHDQQGRWMDWLDYISTRYGY